MKTKWSYFVIFGLLLGGSWYFFSNKSVEKSPEVTQSEKPDKITNRIPASIKQGEPPQMPTFTAANSGSNNPREYFEELRTDQQVDKLYTKSLEVFKDSPQKEDLAIWISIGMTMDSSPKYGSLLNYSLANINQHSQQNLVLIEKMIKGLNQEDSFMRGQLINLVNQMNVEKEEKIKFFGNEMARTVILDAEGRFSPDSLNITTAMIMLKNNGVSKEEANNLITESLQSNNDPKIREKLMTRFEAYF